MNKIHSSNIAESSGIVGRRGATTRAVTAFPGLHISMTFLTTLVMVFFVASVLSTHVFAESGVTRLNHLIDFSDPETRNIRFGTGSRSVWRLNRFQENDSAAIDSIGLSPGSLRRFIDGRQTSGLRFESAHMDSVVARRGRAELDFYGLLGSNPDEEIFPGDSEHWSASVVLRVPVTGINLYGKFGAIHQTQASRGYIDASRFLPNVGSGFHPWSKTEGFASIGAELNLGFFNLFGEYMRIDSESNAESDTFSTGIKVRF